jgi:hypothetical protein
MKLPNSHLAIIEREKICEYLLNAAHPDNGGKALFFIALGFSREEWLTLASALLSSPRKMKLVSAWNLRTASSILLTQD